MKKFFLLSVSLLLIASSMKAQFSGGTGTPENPYQIATPEQLDLIRTRDYLESSYILLNDIDMSTFLSDSETGWIPIGNGSWSYQGNFDGNGKKITGIWSKQKDDFGLFYDIENTNIKDLGVEIDNSKGGFSGRSGGGLIHKAKGSTIDNCYVTGNIYISSSEACGGLIATGQGSSISNCFYKGRIEAYQQIGGLVGFAENGTIVSQCFADAIIHVSHSRAGGLIGIIYDGTVERCFATGYIFADKGSEGIGGLIGNCSPGAIPNYVTVKQCYAANRVVGGSKTGSLVGYFLVKEGVGIEECFAVGKVTNEEYNEGGLVGYVEYSEPARFIERSYFDIERTRKADAIGKWYPESNAIGQGVTGLSTSELQKQVTFSGWNFADVWTIDENQTYPYFQWQNKTDLPDFAPIAVRTAEEFNNIRNNPAAFYSIENDIDLTFVISDSEKGWKPIGDYSSLYFTGDILGNGYTVSGLWSIFRSDQTGHAFEEYAGLFGKALNSTMEKLHVKIDNSKGGLVGETTSILSIYVAGLCSHAIRCTFTECSAEGNLFAAGSYTQAGGLTGKAEKSKIDHCYARTNIDGSNYLGGLSGSLEDNSSVYRCFSVSSIKGNRNTIGGLIGYLKNSDVKQSYAEGAVIMEGGNTTGGFAGEIVGSKIEQTYTHVDVTGNEYSAGFAGRVSESEIKESYSAGRFEVIDSEQERVAGFISDCSKSSVLFSFYDKEKSGLGNAFYVTSGNSDEEAEGKSTMEMKTLLTFIGWDFVNVWKLPPLEYPVFQWKEGDTGIADPGYYANQSVNISVFPNPASEQIILASKESVELYVTLYNLYGQTMHEQKIQNGQITISLNHLPQGIYFITARTPSGASYSKKIIKN